MAMGGGGGGGKGRGEGGGGMGGERGEEELTGKFSDRDFFKDFFL